MQADKRLALLGVLAALALGGHAEAATKAKSKARPAAARSHKAAPGRAKTVAVAAPAAPLKPLSAADAKRYQEAFAAVRRGEFERAAEIRESIANPLLMGRLEFDRLMHPAYVSTYAELADWLSKYRDQPDAVRIYTLAKRKAPSAAALDLAAPDNQGRDESDAALARVEAAAERIEAALPKVVVDAKLQKAREVYYAGDVKKAYALANESGERWVGGLAAFRLKKYDEALDKFAAVAQDKSENEWTRSGAAYWASRAAIAAGRPMEAPRWLALAAETPYTFYGLIAERQLGLDPAVSLNGVDIKADAPREPSREAVTRAVSNASLAALVKNDRRARRAAGFAQIGLKAEAGLELRQAAINSNAVQRTAWTGLARTLGAPLSSNADLARNGSVRFDISQFPTPELAPEGGFTIEKALVYALVRQESKFNPNAASVGGAYGLMQLMPATAARVAGDDKLVRDPTPLKDPGVNLRLGQDYVARLLGAVQGDLLHAIAAYNAGPGVIQKTVKQLGSEADSLLAIESMPGGQTREFVERVAAGYWIYRNLFGQASASLDAAAGGVRTVAAALDAASALDR
jgi:soluble lytic murein transglycosylase-like protein